MMDSRMYAGGELDTGTQGAQQDNPTRRDKSVIGDDRGAEWVVLPSEEPRRAKSTTVGSLTKWSPRRAEESTIWLLP